MYSTLVINIDIIKALGFVGILITGAWTISFAYSRIIQRVKYIEKTNDELKVDLKELTKYVYGNIKINS